MISLKPIGQGWARICLRNFFQQIDHGGNGATAREEHPFMAEKAFGLARVSTKTSPTSFFPCFHGCNPD
jgi:hypothetical protein